MKKTKPNKYGPRHCIFGDCEGKCIPAEWMASGLASPIEYACEKHKDKLAKPDDGYMSEGDYQSWGRL